MAKKTASNVPATAKKSPAPKKKAAAVKSNSVDKVCVAALDKLRELNLDIGLQGEIEWCLASYANDGNPVGLYQMAARARKQFTELAGVQRKAVPAKLMSDLKKVAP